MLRSKSSPDALSPYRGEHKKSPHVDALLTEIKAGKGPKPQIQTDQNKAKAKGGQAKNKANNPKMQERGK